jgi:hypothetical protein
MASPKRARTERGICSLPDDVLYTYFKGSELCLATNAFRVLLGASISPVTVLRGGRAYVAWAETQGFDLDDKFVSAPSSASQGSDFYKELSLVCPTWATCDRFSCLVPAACEQALLFDNADCLAQLVVAVKSSHDCFCHLNEACALGSFRCVEYLFGRVFRDFDPDSYVDDYRIQGVFASAPTPEMVEFLESKVAPGSHEHWPHIVSRCLLAHNFRMVPWWISERSKRWTGDCMSKAITDGSLADMAMFRERGAPLSENNMVDALSTHSVAKLDWLISQNCPVDAYRTSYACGVHCRSAAVVDKLHALGFLEHPSVSKGAASKDNVTMLKIVYNKFRIFPAGIATRAAEHNAVRCLDFLKTVKWQLWKGVPEASVEWPDAFDWSLNHLDCDFDSLIEVVRNMYRRKSICDLYPHVVARGTREQVEAIVEIAIKHPGICYEIIGMHRDRVDKFKKEVEALKTKREMAAFAEVYNIRFSTSWKMARARSELMKRHKELEYSF